MLAQAFEKLPKTKYVADNVFLIKSYTTFYKMYQRYPVSAKVVLAKLNKAQRRLMNTVQCNIKCYNAGFIIFEYVQKF